MIRAKLILDDVIFIDRNDPIRQKIITWFDKNIINIPYIPKIGWQINLADFIKNGEMRKYCEDYFSYPVISGIIINLDYLTISFDEGSAH